MPLAAVHPLNELIVHNNTAIVQLLVIYHSTFLIELINKSSQQNIQYQTVCFSVYFFGKNIRCHLFAVNVFFFCVTVLSPISVAFFDKIRQHQHSTFIYLPILLYKNQPSLDICYFYVLYNKKSIFCFEVFSLYFQINVVKIKPLWWIYFFCFYSSILLFLHK